MLASAVNCDDSSGVEREKPESQVLLLLYSSTPNITSIFACIPFPVALRVQKECSLTGLELREMLF